MSSLLLQPTAIAQWQALVKDAESSSHLTLDKELESYLVFLLGRFNQRTDIANCTLATEFLRSIEKRSSEQRDHLRDIGDKCLLFAGLFPRQAERRRVKIKYFIELGQMAYIQVANLSKTASASLYHALSNAFVSLMEVLQAIRGLGDPMNELTPLEAIELWEDVKSQYALSILRKHSACPIIITPSTQH